MNTKNIKINENAGERKSKIKSATRAAGRSKMESKTNKGTNTRTPRKAVDLEKRLNNMDVETDSDVNFNKRIGDLGENIAVIFLEKRGFQIIDRNYRNKMGELDIIAQKDNFYYVVEVKTLKIPTSIDEIEGNNFFDPDVSIIRDGESPRWLKPEISLTDSKIRRVKTTALKYCMDFNLKEESLRFIGVCISLYHTGSRVTKESLLSCSVKVLPLF